MAHTFIAEPSSSFGATAKQDPHTNGCAHCGRPFGLVRHRLANKQLCSKACLVTEGEHMQHMLKEKVRRFTQLARRD